MRHEDIRLNSKLDGLRYLQEKLAGRTDARVLPFETYERLEDVPFEKYRKAGHARLLVRSEQAREGDLSSEAYIALPRVHVALQRPGGVEAALDDLKKQAENQSAYAPFRWIVHPLREEGHDVILGRVGFTGSGPVVVTLRHTQGWFAQNPFWRRVFRPERGWADEPGIGPALNDAELEKHGVPPAFPEKLLRLVDALYPHVPADVGVEANFTTMKDDPQTPVFYHYLVTWRPDKK